MRRDLAERASEINHCGIDIILLDLIARNGKKIRTLAGNVECTTLLATRLV